MGHNLDLAGLTVDGLAAGVTALDSQTGS
jgi:hypothetical protein